MKDNKVITIRPNGTRRVVTINDEPSRTQQHHRDHTNPNALLRKFGIGAFQTPPPEMYQDLTNLPDLHTAMETIRTAQDSFNALPSAVRTKLKNDPNELINFLNSTDERDIEESIKLGLRNPKPVAPPEDPQLTALKEISSHLKPKKQKPSED